MLDLEVSGTIAVGEGWALHILGITTMLGQTVCLSPSNIPRLTAKEYFGSNCAAVPLQRMEYATIRAIMMYKGVLESVS